MFRSLGNDTEDLISQETATQLLENVRSSPIAKTISPPPRKPIRPTKGQVNRKRTSQVKNGKKTTQEMVQVKPDINSPPTKRMEIAWVYPFLEML